MTASVLYYTSWKNAISPGGFDIYAKDPDICDTDAARIVRLTKYSLMINTSTDSASENIKHIPPKKYTFFRLGSGKFCIACSTYAGKDCYDRAGNYFVHALVLDSLEALRPADLIGSDEFKFALTEAEAEATYPDPPPKINPRDLAHPLLKDDLQRFFDSERIYILKKLATVLTGAQNERVGVVLDDTQQNIKYWHTALSCVLPKSIWQNISFSTYGAERSFMIVSGVQASPFINSIDVRSYTFEMASGAADVKVTPSPLIDHACELFAKDPFEAERFSARIEELSDECDSAEIDRVFKLWCVENNRFDVFDTPADLKITLEKYFNAIPQKAERITQNVVFALSFSLSFEKTAELTELLRFLYSHASQNDKTELLTSYIDSSFEGSAGEQPYKIYENIKRSCICPWGEAVRMLFEPKMLEHIAAFDTVGAHFFICALMIDAFAGASEIRQKNVVEYLKEVCINHIQKGDVPAAALILKHASRKGSGLDLLINTRICESDVDELSESPDRTFEYIEITDTYGECFWMLIINCARRVPESIDALIPSYLSYLKVHPEKRDALEEVGVTKEVCRVFLKAVSLYEFEHLGTYTTELLVAKYEEYMCEENEAIAEKAKRIYLETLSSYLDALDGKERIRACVSILKRIFAKSLPKKADSRILRLMNHAMFASNGISTIKETTTEDFLCNFAAFLENAGIEIAPVARAVIEGDTFALAAKNDPNYTTSLKSIANMAKDHSFTFANNKLTRDELTDFGDLYLPSVIECSRLFAKEDEKLFQSFMEEILYHLTEYESFIITFDEYLDKDLERSCEFLEYAFDYTFQLPDTSMSITVQDVAYRYLERLSGSKRKKVLAHLCENAHSRSKMQKYSINFIENHRTPGARKLILERSGRKRK